MALSLDVYEAHGLSGGRDDPRVGLQETGSGHVAVETQTVGAVLITASEARYLAARLIRLAWRIEARKAQVAPGKDAAE